MSALVQFALDLGVLRVPICRAPRVRRAARVVVVQYVLDLGLEPCERARPTRFPRAPRVRAEIVEVRIGRRPGSRARRESDASYVSWRVEQRLLERGDIEEILRRYQPVIEPFVVEPAKPRSGNLGSFAPKPMPSDEDDERQKRQIFEQVKRTMAQPGAS